MELDLVRMTVSQAMATVREALANYSSSEAIEIRTDNEVVKLNLFNQLNKMGMRCKLERKGSYFLLKAQPKGKVSERQAIRRASRSQVVADEPDEGDAGNEAETPYAAPRQAAHAFPVREENVLDREAVTHQKPKAEDPQPAVQPSPPQAVRPTPISYAAAVTQQRQASRAQSPQGRPEPPPVPASLFNGEYDESPIAPGQGPWLVFQHDQIGQKDNNLGVELLHQMLQSLTPGAYAGLFLVHRGVRLVDPQYHQAKLLRALLRKPIAVFADETSMNYFKLIGRTSPRVKVVPFAALLELGNTQPVIWF